MNSIIYTLLPRLCQLYHHFPSIFFLTDIPSIHPLPRFFFQLRLLYKPSRAKGSIPFTQWKGVMIGLSNHLVGLGSFLSIKLDWEGRDELNQKKDWNWAIRGPLSNDGRNTVSVIIFYHYWFLETSYIYICFERNNVFYTVILFLTYRTEYGRTFKQW